MASSPTLIVPGGPAPAPSQTKSRGSFITRFRDRIKAQRDAAAAAQQAITDADAAATTPPAPATQQQSSATAAASGAAQRTRRRAAAGNAGPRKAKGSSKSTQSALAPAGVPLMLIGGTA